jgi:hypothetical protein
MKGREGVLEKFDVDRNAGKMVEVFEGLKMQRSNIKNQN